jgi:hypothetical protein
MVNVMDEPSNVLAPASWVRVRDPARRRSIHEVVWENPATS